MRRSHARSRVDSNKHPMDPIKFPARPTTRSRHSKPGFVSPLVASILILIALFSCYWLFVNKGSVNFAGSKRYGIIIDGGSTGTRIHVFSYRVQDGRPVFDFGEDAMRVNPGLSSYSEDPDEAGGSLKELIEFGKGRVPRELWNHTEIWLMATAGMRLLDVDVQDRILEACRRVLRTSGFKFDDKWASVITGSDEGVYAWVVANYALGTLGGDPRQTSGIIELGGASAQVTFVPDEPVPPEFSRTVTFGNVTFSIYSHSFLHFGQNVAFEAFKESLAADNYGLTTSSLEKQTIIDPCTPKDYSHATVAWKLAPGPSTEKNKLPSLFHSKGNFSECRTAALTLLQKGKDKCQYQHCYIGSTFIPKLVGKFLATENFYHTSKFFGLDSRGFLSSLMVAGQQFCGQNWSKLKMKYQSHSDEDLVRYCFSSAYIVALLHDSLGVALDDERISYASQVGNIPLEWALGAFILQSTANLNSQPVDWIATVINDDSPTLFSLIAISILLMFVAWSISKCRKPNLKTVYDLEKGRYIVTRVGRSS
ncbi:hypothetical protein K2173_006412 [Erythroxylum novogranatense]|uniref:Apyrase n=1 Tax=Erythroxylum novogranatense TaxID=1862640 RepID=A0AAV8U390_9ROSI|nr:hypothetical protein K2173_006412 [Erythroxylum novogranatense]